MDATVAPFPKQDPFDCRRHMPLDGPDSPEVAMSWLNQDDMALKLISYAQNHEDVLLARALPHSSGLYIDVGANHPVFHSVTKLFTNRAWQGINIEPSPPIFDVLQRDRSHQINLNVGVGNVAGTLPFYEVPEYHGWSSFRIELADHYREMGIEVEERAVPVRTLADICEQHVGDQTIDFLKVDAEGFEPHVLAGADFNRWRPRVLVAENAWHEAWEYLVLGANYILAANDGINRFYVRGEEPELLAAFAMPVNVLDNFISYELLRMVQYLDAEARRKFSIINAIRNDTPRVMGRFRSMFQGKPTIRKVG